MCVEGSVNCQIWIVYFACSKYMLHAQEMNVNVAMKKEESIRKCVCVLKEVWIFEYGLYMFRVAYM